MPAKKQDKVLLTCPHCGHQQRESREAFSTICKECGQHLRVQEILHPPRKASARAPNQKRITCFECGAELVIPASAESTMCKRCSQYVDLHDYRITTAVAKNFKTKGAFMVELKGYVFNTESIVGDAVIKGKFHGKLAALGSLTIYSTADTAAFARASEAAALEKKCPEHFSALYGVWSGGHMRGESAAMREHAAAFLRDVERRPHSPEAGVAHRINGITRWFAGELPKRAAITKRRSPFSIPRATRIWRIGSGKTRASARWHIGRWRCGRSAKSTAPFGRWRRRRPEPPNLRTSARSLTARCTRLCSR